MDAGAPMPAVYSDETGLTCAYVIGATHSESGSTAILHFEGVLYYGMGYPNDEALRAHPLYENGLGLYDFHVVENSPLIADLDRRNQVHNRHVAGNYLKRFRHWIITFHDETLEVVATCSVPAHQREGTRPSSSGAHLRTGVGELFQSLAPGAPTSH